MEPLVSLGRFASIRSMTSLAPSPDRIACVASPSLQTHERDARVDWLRGAAALFVMVYHFFAPLHWSQPPPLHLAARFASLGWLGVPVFFVLSGFCITRGWLTAGVALRFVKRRARRIYPPYLASLAVCLFTAAARLMFTGVNDLAPIPSTPLQIIATLSLTTAPATAVPALNWVYWSLSCEVAYYGLLALLLLVPSGRPRIGGWLAMHAMLCAADIAGLSREGTPLFFIGNWPLFALGAGLMLFQASPRWGLASMGLSTVHLLALALLGRFSIVHYATLCAMAALLLPHRFWSPVPDNMLPRIGIISYSLYLVHVPVGVFLLLLPISKLLAEYRLATAFGLVIAAAGSVIFAWLFHRFAERPWMRPAATLAPP